MLICIMNDKSMSFEIIWHIANFHRDSYGELVLADSYEAARL